MQFDSDPFDWFSIFFDLHCARGDTSLLTGLQKEVLEKTPVNTIFLAYMAANALQYQPPLRLFNLRAELGLPRYNAHGALEDAIGTAELFLTPLEHLGGGKSVPIKSLLS